jgi:hypothetical protein
MAPGVCVFCVYVCTKLLGNVSETIFYIIL